MHTRCFRSAIYTCSSPDKISVSFRLDLTTGCCNANQSICGHFTVVRVDHAAPERFFVNFPPVIYIFLYQVETFEDGIVVAEYAKLFAKNPRDESVGSWERGLTKLLGRPSRHREVM